MLIRISMLIMFVLTISCASPNRHFVRDDQYIKQQIKKVLFLPVYVDSAYFPAIPIQDMPIIQTEYPTKFRADLRSRLLEKSAVIDEAAVDALKAGFKFEIIQGSQSQQVGRIKRRNSPFGREGHLKWSHNYVYEVPPEVIRDLTQQTGTDAVFFHYVQMHKVWEGLFSSWSKTTGPVKTTFTERNILPRDVLIYIPQLYSQDGSLVYGGERVTEFEFKGKNVGNSNGDVLLSLESVDSNWKLGRLSEKDVLDTAKAIDAEYLGIKWLKKPHTALGGLNAGRAN